MHLMLDEAYAVVDHVELFVYKGNPMEITLGKNLPKYHACVCTH